MSSIFGNNIKVSVFGQSHSRAIGCVIDSLPAGINISLSKLQSFMERRAPGRNQYSTPRKEGDVPEFVSGVLPKKDDHDTVVTCGAPICALIYNSDTRSSDYDAFYDIPRPSHADYSANLAYGGYQDVRGGGHFSGRLTAPLCIAGGICIQYLESIGIFTGAHIASVGEINDTLFDPVNVSKTQLEAVKNVDFPTLDFGSAELMKALIESCKKEGDSIGGTVECAVIGLPAGLGAPMFDTVEGMLAKALFAVPAVKGVEFGSGFAGSRQKGTQSNDPFAYENTRVITLQNNSGGIQGGITNGMPIIFRTAFKATPTIAREQASISFKSGENTILCASGRHDPCIVQRAVPVVEAVTALTLCDIIFQHKKHI